MATTWTIDGVKEALAAKKISARELLGDFYRRIEARNPELNAYLALTPERARRQADRIDALVAAGSPLPPLAGVPMAIKDVISTRGTKTTCGSKILENYIPPYDATAVERLEAAGANLERVHVLDAVITGVVLLLERKLRAKKQLYFTTQARRFRASRSARDRFESGE